MRSSSLESRTIRPGLLAYSSYRSNRSAGPRLPATPIAPATHYLRNLVLTLVAVAVLFGGLRVLHSQGQTPAPAQTPAIVAGKSIGTPASHCAGNTLDKHLIISVSERHLWACAGSKAVYDTVVITGMEAHDSTKTPVGEYHVYAKQTDTVLTGSDETGSWRDPVAYWMPFLDNQFGTYGFHDASWRQPAEFGTVDPNSEKASHGCIELPSAASKWLYSWTQVGTTVTVQS